jgi:hypothetical protein
MDKGRKRGLVMSDPWERLLFHIIGLPHGGALCWAGRIMCLGWVLYHMVGVAFVLAYGGILGNPFLVVLAIGLVAGLAGLRWHLVSAALLMMGGMGGVLCLGLGLMMSQSEPSAASILIWILVTVAVVAGGIVNLMAWLNERRAGLE